MKIFVCMPIVTGNGSKYMATNLAHYTKTMFPTKKVALVDFDFKHPHLAEKLSLHDTIHSIDNLTDKIDGNFLDINLFIENMIKLKSGVELLKGTKLTHNIDLIKKHHIEKIIELLKSYYDYVFIAVSNEALSGTVYSLFNANEVLLIAKNNYANFKEAKKALNLINHYKGNEAHLSLIINQYSDISEVTFSDYIEKFNILNIELVPYDEQTFDHNDLDKSIIASKVFKSKKKSQEVFETLIEKFIV